MLSEEYKKQALEDLKNMSSKQLEKILIAIGSEKKVLRSVKKLEKNVTVICSEKDGRISARTVVRIAETVKNSNSECSITRGYKTVNAVSVLFLMSLGLKDGDNVTVKSNNKNCVDKICEVLTENEI